VNRPAKEKRRLAIFRLFLRSEAVRTIMARHAWIERQMREKPRKVWPFAKIARLFGISPSLLRKWVAQGLITRFRPPSAHHREGLTERAVREFLREVAERADSGIEFTLRRPRPAVEKCRKVLRELQRGEALTPREFAARAGVAPTTVHRLLAEHFLVAWYPTPYRPKICDFLEKDRRIRLTRKKAKTWR
jgi:transposase-like protein